VIAAGAGGNCSGPAGKLLIQAVELGRDHTCVLLCNGSIGCAGSNSEGQLGNSQPDSGDNPVLAPAAALPVAQQSGGNTVMAGGIHAYWQACQQAARCTVLAKGFLGSWETTKRQVLSVLWKCRV
jgi:alpha-tubulin suppressor-like RCC1 family protein